MKDQGAPSHRVHHLLDVAIEQTVATYRAAGGQIYCTKGCQGCCTMTVHATLGEASVIAESITTEQLGRLEDYRVRLLTILPEAVDFKTFLRLHRTRLGACPFLDTSGCCQIYPLRPLACRALLSTRPSAWCAADFSILHPAEKEAFRSSLDRAVVAFPTHYLAAPQSLAKNLEDELISSMSRDFGVAISGLLPLLVLLARTDRLGQMAWKGEETIRALLQKRGVSHPFLIDLHL